MNVSDREHPSFRDAEQNDESQEDPDIDCIMSLVCERCWADSFSSTDFQSYQDSPNSVVFAHKATISQDFNIVLNIALRHEMLPNRLGMDRFQLVLDAESRASWIPEYLFSGASNLLGGSIRANAASNSIAATLVTVRPEQVNRRHDVRWSLRANAESHMELQQPSNLQ
ncbi:hypothetical protein BCR34DRAFT_613538 [Clohesyomyces aquaticus]|uniref:Uncharacterized protein n=1 Tax=Clohesyomyces aquaticus TaxID=1231657 RepID=A0A1Y1ZSE8_9PLEO|nr:hypothetical protein BCR34DRAFT_613538 [Clohesyomyces aquaticus]